MSTDTRPAPTVEPTGQDRLLADVEWFRVAALGGLAVLTWSYVSVLREITRIVGGTDVLVPTVFATALAGMVLARYLDERRAAVLGGVLLVGGYLYYLQVTPGGVGVVVTATGALISDAIALLTGLSVLRMVGADVWALSFAPAPVFLSWYLATRDRYVAGSVVGGGALLVLVLTGDALPVGTLIGVLGGIVAVGAGELHRIDGTVLQADTLAVLVAVITVASLTLSLSFVPGVANDPLELGEGAAPAGGTSTIEGTAVGATGELQVVGSIELSPAARFSVTADEPRYWRSGVYDRYTGDGWRRTGRASGYDGPLADPPGERKEVVQTFVAESRVQAMPAAAEPVRVEGGATEITEVTPQGTLQPRGSLIEGDAYRVRSLVPNATPEQLREAGTDPDYPDEVADRYLELPEDTPDRVGRLTARITEPADNSYDAAKLVEGYLERNKNYSLEVDRPDSNVADTFLFEMDRGYCTYYATTMAVMLRSQGIPARVASGYTTGQQVDDDEWVVRGLNSHVWVEAYFPEHGWVTFDPTPASDRERAELQRVSEARENDEAGVDTGDSENEPLTETPIGPTTTASAGEGGASANGTTAIPPGLGPVQGGEGVNGTVANGTAGGPSDRGDGLPPLPSREEATLGLVLVAGVAAGAHRLGLTRRARNAVLLRRQGERTAPRADVERAYQRLELLLAQEYRDRERGETPREYVVALGPRGLDSRARRVAAIRERARYAGVASEDDADEAIDLVDQLVAERTPLLRRIRGN